MCNESLKISPLQIGKVSQGSVQSYFAISRCQRREPKSVFVKLMRLVKRMINAHGKERRGGGGGKGGRQSKSVRISCEEIGTVEIERANIGNDEEESNNSAITAKMTYTIEELKEIVDDNLENELRAARIFTE